MRGFMIDILRIGFILLLTVSAARAEELRSELSDQTLVAVTIYNQNLALIRDSREVTLKKGIQSLAMRDVSAQIRPETALVTTKEGSSNGVRVLEQNFDFDLLTPTSLLEKFVGREVTAITINSANGNETRETATVLATNQGAVLQFADRIETQFPGRLIFDSVPDSLRDRPTLLLSLDSAVAGPQNLELSYLTSGLGWKADYVASLNDKEDALDLSGWVTLTNQSGTTYQDALLQLVAGDVQQVQQDQPQMRSLALESAAVASSAGVQQESLFDYHLYTLPRATTLRNQQTKQVALMQASAVPVTKSYVLNSDGRFFGGRSGGEIKQKIGVFLEFENAESDNLGIPLPAGVIRVYKNDSSGRIQFIGEDGIDHTPKREQVRLKLGEAFDVTAKSTQTGFKKVSSTGQYNFSAEISQRVSLSNAKSESVRVSVREVIPGDWQLIDTSHQHQKLASNLVEWQIDVPGETSVSLDFTALVRY